MASRPPDTYTNRCGEDGNCGLGVIINLTGGKVVHSGLNENARNIRKLFPILHLRHTTLDVNNELVLHSVLTAITNPPIPVSTSVMKEDSFAFIALLSRGDDEKTLLPNGKTVLHTYIEQYFNEDNCRILRGKPKIFLLLIYYTKISEDNKPIDLQPSATPATKDIDLDLNMSSTSLHTFSFYIYDFDLPSLLTEDKGSVVLHHLPEHINSYGHDYDVVSCLKKFLGKMSSLQDKAESPGNKRFPTICIIMRNRLMCKLFFLPPQVERHEEQDVEVYLSDDLNRLVSLSPQISPATATAIPLRVTNNPVVSPYPTIRCSTSNEGTVEHNSVFLFNFSRKRSRRRRRTLARNPNHPLQTMSSTPDPNIPSVC